MQTVCILGRQPELGLAELESLYGADTTQPLGNHAALLDIEDVAFTRLGGCTRSARVLATLPTTNWHTIESHIEKLLPELADNIYEGKIRFGISHIGPGVNPRTLNTLGLKLKKLIKAAGHSVRVVPNSAPELNTAQVLHNQLTGPTGIEILVIPDRTRTVIAQTTAVQDINAYAARDQRRPKRDARVGMLPPKLAQIIVNLAIGGQESRVKSQEITVLDPFCGTGVVLQEALLMGYGTYGTDLEIRMVEYSQANLDWLVASPHFTVHNFQFLLEAGDATNHQWKHFDTIACETYLGRPLANLPTPDKLSEIIADCDTIHRKFLKNLAKQTKPGFRACIAVPAWKTPNGFKHLRTLDSLEELGYNRMRFVHVDSKGLIYHRPDQLVARELVILERI
jgi:SAM-dependent methyltransferase